MPLKNGPIPKNLDEAVNTLVYDLDREEIAFIQKSKPEQAHFPVGMNLRNDWGLWCDSVLAQWFKQTLGLGHADDMSGIILRAVWCKIKGDKYDLDSDVEHYKKFWRDQNVDPLTQQKTTVVTEADAVDGKDSSGFYGMGF